jgi:hypothetical protein
MRAVEDWPTVSPWRSSSTALAPPAIGQNRIECQGEVIYENNNPDDSVARHFFRDGVREIGFHRASTGAGGRFMDLYRRALSREAGIS